MRAFILSLSLFIEAYSALKFVLITVRAVACITGYESESMGVKALSSCSHMQATLTCDGNSKHENAAKGCERRDEASHGCHRCNIAVSNLNSARK